MILKVNLETLDWLNKNIRFLELDEKQQQELFESLPQQEGTWQPPDFAVEMIRERVKNKMDILSTLLNDMEKQTIRGSFNIDLTNVSFD